MHTGGWCAEIHKAWFIKEFDSKEAYFWCILFLLLIRHTASIIELTTFSKSDIQEFAKAGNN